MGEFMTAKSLAKELSNKLDSVIELVMPGEFGQVGLNFQQTQLKAGMLNMIKVFTQEPEGKGIEDVIIS